MMIMVLNNIVQITVIFEIFFSGRQEFMNVADLLNVPVSEVNERTTWLEKTFPAIYTSLPSEYLKTFVDSM